MPGRLPKINLLPEYKRDSNAQAVIFYLFLALTIVAMITISYFYFSTKGKLETVMNERTKLTDQRDILAAQIGTLEDDDLSLYEQSVLFAENYALPTSTLIVELNELLPPKSYLTNYSFDGAGVKIVSHFETLDSIASYTVSLEESDFLTEMQVDSIRTFTLRTGEEDETDRGTQFDVLPRYESDFSLKVHKEKLKGESANHD